MAILASQKAGETGPRMVVVFNAALQKRDEIAQLGQLEDELRLRLAAQAAGCVAFDWDVTTGHIRWDGATDILPLHLDTVRAQSFLDGVAMEGRCGLMAVIEARDTTSNFFLTDIEVASAMGAVTFTMAGTRVSG